GRPVPSCLVLAASCEGHKITTVEGLVKDGSPHAVQEAMVETGGVQCGFCTPGIIMTSVALLRDSIDGREEQARRLAGNLCRCTGYKKIFQALEVAGNTDD
ncbi:MAG: (2Fe-2S)-binding protein, partial [Acidobacteria bacterium]